MHIREQIPVLGLVELMYAVRQHPVGSGTAGDRFKISAVSSHTLLPVRSVRRIRESETGRFHRLHELMLARLMVVVDYGPVRFVPIEESRVVKTCFSGLLTFHKPSGVLSYLVPIEAVPD